MKIGTRSARRAIPAYLGRLVLLGMLVAACSQPASQFTAQEPGSDAACAVDGMLLKDYPGPKGQTQYLEGNPDYFCDLIDMFSTLLAPEQKRPVATVFVQDMGKTSWENPTGNWIDAKLALYVVGSRKHGAMGPTFASFSRMEDAEAFAKKEGGRILRFDQINLDLVKSSRGGLPQNGTMH
jgi:copper chaperone NosL